MNIVALRQVLTQTPADYAAGPADAYFEIVRQTEELQKLAKALGAFVQRTGELRYSERAKSMLRESGRDFGAVRIADEALRVKYEVSKRVQWDQKRLAEIAKRILASGEAVEGYLDVKLAVPESRFINWPPALQQQFAAARTATPGSPSIEVTIDPEVA